MKYTREQIQSTVEGKGYKYFQDNSNKTYDVNVIGIRNDETKGRVTNAFDDLMTISYKNEDEEINEMIEKEVLSEMRIRELNEISKVVKKEDFYEFINKGNNILRDLEGAGMGNGKKYLIYLIKHNIM